MIRAVIVLATLAIPCSALADTARSAEADKAVRGLARVNDPATAAYVAATALADESFGLSTSLRELLDVGSHLQAAPLDALVTQTLDADETLRGLFRKACGVEWSAARDSITQGAGKNRIEAVVTHCKTAFDDPVKPAYRSRLHPGAVLLAALAEADLARHGATSASERKLARYLALLALAKSP